MHPYSTLNLDLLHTQKLLGNYLIIGIYQIEICQLRDKRLAGAHTHMPSTVCCGPGVFWFFLPRYYVLPLSGSKV